MTSENGIIKEESCENLQAKQKCDLGQISLVKQAKTGNKALEVPNFFGDSCPVSNMLMI